MRKFKSILVSLTILFALCFVAVPVQVRAETGSGEPQGTSNSQSSGSSGLTLAQIAALIAAARSMW